jgi:hypothetical protein
MAPDPHERADRERAFWPDLIDPRTSFFEFF